MKKGNLVLLPIFALASLVACEKNTQVEAPEEGVFTVSRISADYTPVSEVETKNEIGPVSFEVYWTEGDKIAIVNMDNGTIHSYTVNGSSVGKKNGVFDADATYEYSNGDRLVAVYPYDAASWSGGNLYVTLKDAVEYRNAKIIPAFAANDIQVSKIMTGAQFKSLIAASSSLSFYRMVGLVTLTCVVSPAELRAQTAFELALYNEGICGTTQVTFNDDGVPEVAASSGTGSNNSRLAIALNPGHDMSSISYVVKFIPVIPVNENKGFSFVLRTEDYDAGFYLKQDKTITSNLVQSFVIYDGNYTQVASQMVATTHHDWWWGAKVAYANAGSFVSVPEMVVGGNTAGSFENVNVNGE